MELRCSFDGVGILQGEIGVLIPSLQAKKKQETFILRISCSIMSPGGWYSILTVRIRLGSIYVHSLYGVPDETKSKNTSPCVTCLLSYN